jgi:hypothetical protein
MVDGERAKLAVRARFSPVAPCARVQLMAQAAAFSRRRYGFDSRREHHAPVLPDPRHRPTKPVVSVRLGARVPAVTKTLSRRHEDLSPSRRNASTTLRRSLARFDSWRRGRSCACISLCASEARRSHTPALVVRLHPQRPRCSPVVGRLLREQEIGGSTPLTSTMPDSLSGRAPPPHGGREGFESLVRYQPAARAGRPASSDTGAREGSTPSCWTTRSSLSGRAPPRHGGPGEFDPHAPHHAGLAPRPGWQPDPRSLTPARPPSSIHPFMRIEG